MSIISAAVTARHPSFHPAVFGGVPALEKRRTMRARANWAARLIDAVGVINVGRVCDVSEGGFGVMSGVNMPVGSIVDICLAVPKIGNDARSVPVRCKVRVNSCSFAGIQSRLGVTFMDLPKESRIAIRNYILSHS